jgi:hypothetical protein
MLPNGEQTEAADVWVSHWNSEGIDVYVRHKKWGKNAP